MSNIFNLQQISNVVNVNIPNYKDTSAYPELESYLIEKSERDVFSKFMYEYLEEYLTQKTWRDNDTNLFNIIDFFLKYLTTNYLIEIGEKENFFDIFFIKFFDYDSITKPTDPATLAYNQKYYEQFYTLFKSYIPYLSNYLALFEGDTTLKSNYKKDLLFYFGKMIYEFRGASKSYEYLQNIINPIQVLNPYTNEYQILNIGISVEEYDLDSLNSFNTTITPVSFSYTLYYTYDGQKFSFYKDAYEYTLNNNLPLTYIKLETIDNVAVEVQVSSITPHLFEYHKYKTSDGSLFDTTELAQIYLDESLYKKQEFEYKVTLENVSIISLRKALFDIIKHTVHPAGYKIKIDAFTRFAASMKVNAVMYSDIYKNFEYRNLDSENNYSKLEIKSSIYTYTNTITPSNSKYEDSENQNIKQDYTLYTTIDWGRLGVFEINNSEVNLMNDINDGVDLDIESKFHVYSVYTDLDDSTLGDTILK